MDALAFFADNDCSNWTFLVVKSLCKVYSKNTVIERYDAVLHNGGEKIELF